MSGGKGQTSTSQVQIPAQVLAQYQTVNAKANQVDSQPFQAFTGQSVAPVNAQQQQGIAATNTAAGSYQPYTNAATGYTVAGGQAVDPSQLDIGKYLSPYLKDVAGTQEALNQQQYGQAQSGALGTAIQSGAFGGDRAGIAAANLQQQENLANNAEMAGILNTGYDTALSTAQQQQGVGLGAAQANRAATQQTGQALANLGAQTQGLGLAGAQAQIGAGSLEQQTQQAQDSFAVQQYLQQQSLPYQQIGQLADIAEGIGANSGSTTTTNTTSNGLFSDERLKEDIRPVGETFDGQKIYTYKYLGHPHTHMGLMAQNVEHKHPEAVGLASGYKTVDYKKATDKAADRGHFAAGGSLPYDGTPTVTDMMAGRFQQMYGGLLAPQSGQMVPQHSGATAQLHPAQAGATMQNPSAMNQAASAANDAVAINKAGQQFGLWGKQTDSAPSSYDIAAPDQDALADQYTNALVKADGGSIPYGGDEIDVPQDQQWAQLKPAQATSGGGAQDNTLKDIGQIAQIAAMFAANGGRIERADGGGVDDLSPESLIKMLRDRYMQQEDDVAQGDEQNNNQSDNDNADVHSSSSSSNGSSGSIGNSTKAITPSGLGGASGGKGSIADRNNNPGNIEDGKLARSMPGYAGGNGRFAKFESHEAGRAAQMALLESYIKRGYDTPIKLASRWAPAGDGNNNPAKYASFIGKGLGLGLNDKITPDKLAGLAVAQGKMEGYHRQGFAQGGPLRQAFANSGAVGDGGSPIDDAADPNSEEARRRFLEQFDSTVGNNQNPQPDAQPNPAPPRDAGLASASVANGLPADTQYGEPDTATAAAQDRSYALSDEQPWSAQSAPQILQKYLEKTPDYYQNGRAPTDGNFFDQLKHGKTDAILSVLSGLSAAATSNTRNPLTAAFSGLGAGAQAYQGQRAFEQERAKNAQDLALQRGKLGIEGALASGELSMTPAQIYEMNARGELTDVQARTYLAQLQYAGQLAAAKALREKREANLTGRSVLTPAGPGAGSGVADLGTDKPGYTPIVPYGLPPQPGDPAPSTGASPGPKPVTQSPAPAPAPKASGSWSGVETPANVPKPPANFWVNGGMERYRADAADQIKTLRDRSEHAQQALTQLQQLKDDFSALPDSGLQTPGAGGEKGLDVIRKLNGAAAWLGLPQFQSTSVAEHLEKIARGIAAGTAADMHEGRGVGVLDLALKRNPTMANTKTGAIDILNSMIENEKRVGIRDKYFNNWIQHPNSFGTVLGAQEGFERDNRPEYFSARAHRQTILDTAAPEDVADLRKNPKAAWRAFEKQYGPGSAALLVGKKAIGG